MATQHCRCLLSTSRINLFIFPKRHKSTGIERITEKFNKKIKVIHEKGLYRMEWPVTYGMGQVQIHADRKEKPTVTFTNNDYLGLDGHPALVEAQQKGLKRWGTRGLVRSLDGTLDIHRQLEAMICKFHSQEEAVVFPTAQALNRGLYRALFDEDDHLFSDELNHASIVDGLRLSKAQKSTYSHREYETLDQMMTDSKKNKIIITEGVYSMDGTICRLDIIFDLAKKHNAVVVLDDTHGTGVLGKNLKGTDEHFGLLGDSFIMISTLSKGLGLGTGAYVCGPSVAMDVVRQFSRAYVDNVNMEGFMVESAIKVFEMLPKLGHRRDKAFKLSARLRAQIHEAGFPKRGDEHPIVPVICGGSHRAIEVARKIYEDGYHGIGLSYPVVPMGESRIRCTTTAGHTEEHIDGLAESLIRVGREMGFLPKQSTKVTTVA